MEVAAAIMIVCDDRTRRAAVEATVAQQEWRDSFGEMVELVAGCYPRRETRQTFREMTEAMLMALWPQDS